MSEDPRYHAQEICYGIALEIGELSGLDFEDVVPIWDRFVRAFDFSIVRALFRLLPIQEADLPAAITIHLPAEMSRPVVRIAIELAQHFWLWRKDSVTANRLCRLRAVIVDLVGYDNLCPSSRRSPSPPGRRPKKRPQAGTTAIGPEAS